MDWGLRSGARAAVDAASSCPRSSLQAGASAGAAGESFATSRCGMVAGADCRTAWPRDRATTASVTNRTTVTFIGAVGLSMKPCIAGYLAKSTGAGRACPMADGGHIGQGSIHDRPAVVETRTRSGDWEADLLSSSKPGQFLLAAQERGSRRAMLVQQKARTA